MYYIYFGVLCDFQELSNVGRRWEEGSGSERGSKTCVIFTITEQWKEGKGWGIGTQDDLEQTEVPEASYCGLNNL